MNLHQFLSDLLQEECNEVGQRASKLSRFGYDEIQPGQSLNKVSPLKIAAFESVGVPASRNSF